MNTEISYVEVDLKEVLNHYIKGYTFTNGSYIIGSDSFIDTVKGKVIFKFLVSNQNN
jgi:hypothetical protein